MNRKVVSIAIDPQGNLRTDFSGFADRSCEIEEKQLRAILAELGLDIQVIKSAPKHVETKPVARLVDSKRVGT